MVRLSKRMGELDLFSRREADRLIQDGRVLMNGSVVEVGQKVPYDLRADQIKVLGEDGNDSSASENSSGTRNGEIWENPLTAVVLNKPKGYVSGQAEHGHPPAIRLLTDRNRLWDDDDSDRYDKSSSGKNHRRSHFVEWKGFAPAGRLDLDSRGLVIFTKNGVLAKKLIGASSSVEKEYIVDVIPAKSPTRKELSVEPTFQLPSPPKIDLTSLLKGGQLLLGDDRPLKACPEVSWIEQGEKLRIVLTEGRKHHIRRVCRQLLGYHVVGLQRVRVGSIALPSKSDELPEGCWRPLQPSEIEALLQNDRE